MTGATACSSRYMWHLSDMDGPFRMVAGADLIQRDATRFSADTLKMFFQSFALGKKEERHNMESI